MKNYYWRDPEGITSRVGTLDTEENIYNQCDDMIFVFDGGTECTNMELFDCDVIFDHCKDYVEDFGAMPLDIMFTIDDVEDSDFVELESYIDFEDIVKALSEEQHKILNDIIEQA